MLAPESTFWICLGKCAHWLLEIQDSRNRLSEWGGKLIGIILMHQDVRWTLLFPMPGKYLGPS